MGIHRRWPQVVEMARPSSSRQHALHLISVFRNEIQLRRVFEIKKPVSTARILSGIFQKAYKTLVFIIYYIGSCKTSLLQKQGGLNIWEERNENRQGGKSEHKLKMYATSITVWIWRYNENPATLCQRSLQNCIICTKVVTHKYRG